MKCRANVELTEPPDIKRPQLIDRPLAHYRARLLCQTFTLARECCPPLTVTWGPIDITGQHGIEQSSTIRSSRPGIEETDHRIGSTRHIRSFATLTGTGWHPLPALRHPDNHDAVGRAKPLTNGSSSRHGSHHVKACMSLCYYSSLPSLGTKSNKRRVLHRIEGFRGTAIDSCQVPSSSGKCWACRVQRIGEDCIDRKGWRSFLASALWAILCSEPW
jgi:hypothetical protein